MFARTSLLKPAIAGLMAVTALTATLPSPTSASDGARGVAEYSGILVPAREAEITPIVSAWRRAVNFESGQMVKKGDPLFLFHTKPAELRLQLAQAELEKAEANVGLAELGVLQMTQLTPFDGVLSAPMVRENRGQDISKSGDGDITMAIILPDGSIYPHNGHLVSGGYTFDEDSQKIKVWGEFPNPDHFLRPGLRVTVQSQLKSG